VTLNVLGDEPMPPVFVASTVILVSANMLFAATAMTYWLFVLLDSVAPVGNTGVFHDIPGVVPPLFVTVIVLALVVSITPAPTTDSDGGFPAYTVNVLLTATPAPFVAVTVIASALML
jgi:hypothetical protein